ncbi:hypothetical protein [Rathayibacter festucae]|uniref:hypothetical protein n=1 Tax=Rathayibacter festucae TaxID=110937 RepID=UPI000FDBE411|nr:hypothetical protein [Rathayibacter festucae]
MRPLRRRLPGWALVLLSVPLGLASIALGWTFDGMDPMSVQCSRGPFPEAGGLSESFRITGDPTLLPLGVTCTYDAVGDDVGPQTTHHDDFPATVGLLVSVLAFGGGGALVLVRD